MNFVQRTEIAGSAGVTHASPALTEADRLMTVCNSCRYCEGLCAVFPAMEMRRSFQDGDLNYIANLCHSCGACSIDCQFSAPHEFDVNVPRTLALVRAESYAAYAWPQALAPVFARNGLWISLVAAASVAIFIVGFMAYTAPDVLFATHTGPGAFYRIMPHNTMAAIFGAAFLFAIVALVMGLRNFWRDIGEPSSTLTDPPSLWQAIKDAGSLRYLDGGGVGCYNDGEKPDDMRKHWHHMTFYGFLLCFAATSTATIYHYVFGIQAPYGYTQLPKILGLLGGIGLVLGPIGLMRAKKSRDPLLVNERHLGMDWAFLVMLFLTGATGLVLMVLKATPLMGLLLAVHLGVIFALFITMPYGKMVHGLYRFLALVRYARESKAMEAHGE